MNDLLLSTKGKNNTYKLIFSLIGILGIVAGVIFFFTFTANTSYRMSDEMQMVGVIIPALFIGLSLVAFLFVGIHCNAYVDVYKDHCEGKGIQNKALKTFYLYNSQIKNVTRESYYLCLHTDIGEFKIICSKNVSQEIFRYFNASRNR